MHHGGVAEIADSLTSQPDVGGWPTPPSGHSTPRMGPDTHCIGNWVEPRADLDECGENMLPPPGLEPQTFQPVASGDADYAIPPPPPHVKFYCWQI
jgi:hypothetical protein